MSYSVLLDYTDESIRYYAAIAELPWAVWLDSARLGRYEILCAQPIATLTAHDGYTAITDAAGTRRTGDTPFGLVRRRLGAMVEPMPGVPFAGGALGYWGYDLARRMVDLPVQAQDAEHLPYMAVGIYDWAIVLDHQKKTARLVSHQCDPATAQTLPEIRERLAATHAFPPVRKGGEATFRVGGPIRSNFNRTGYRSAFEAVQRYLYAGDCYQVNLAQRYAAPATGDALQAYIELRNLSPAPYSAFLNLPYGQILCASPERFLRVTGGSVETRPIKGTRPRMRDAWRDAQVAEELRNSAKDRAENLMIVDLLRNDLGKCCEPGSVRASNLFEVESYAQVHHLVSTVTGKLAQGQDALALLEGCFPGGSVTGAPKQRAMEIIEELEPHRRGVYCGAIGYIGYDGNMDSNIAIRTLIYSENEIRFWAGSGIVADSEAEAEYQETQDKAAAMLKLLQRFGGTHRA
jgi:para-aminobenzoate synthetase component 1